MKKLRHVAEEAPLFQWFHQNTKLSQALALGPVPRFPLLPPIKRYQAVLGRVELPLPEAVPTMTLLESLWLRRSVRDFDREAPIELPALAGILHYSYGVTHREGSFEFRAAASAGARYPVEVYVVAQRVAGLDPGVYHFDAQNHKLDWLRSGQIETQCWAPEGTGNGQVLETASCTIVMTAVFSRSTEKYGERGYRYVLMDAGHLAQNIYLCATAYDVGAVEIGGFSEEVVEDELGLDGVAESGICLMALGHDACRWVTSSEARPAHGPPGLS